MFELNRPRSTFSTEPSKPYFMFESFFCQTFFLSDSSLFKIWDWKSSPPAERGKDWYYGAPIQFTREAQPSILKDNFSTRTDLSIFTSIVTSLNWSNEISWVFPALKSTSPVFSICKIKSCCDRSFHQQIRPQATVPN